MMFVRLVRVSFSYSDSVPLLTDVDFQLTNGWTAMVGANGTGKTTLLRLISGELAPDSGDIHFAPPHPRIAVCRQTAETLTDEIEEFGSALDRESHRIRDSLKLSAADLSRWSTLSPGERRRFQIGAALATDPSMLILDEPTDHLDGEAREILVSALMRFGGIGVVVSHDRTLLDALTTSTVRTH